MRFFFINQRTIENKYIELFIGYCVNYLFFLAMPYAKIFRSFFIFHSPLLLFLTEKQNRTIQNEEKKCYL